MTHWCPGRFSFLESLSQMLPPPPGNCCIAPNSNLPFSGSGLDTHFSTIPFLLAYFRVECEPAYTSSEIPREKKSKSSQNF
jgi:hypothetical protein